MINRFLSLLWILISVYTLEVCAVPPEGKVGIHGFGQGNAVVITVTKPGEREGDRPKTVAILVDAGTTAASYVARQQKKDGGSNTTFSLLPKAPQPKLGEKEPVEEDEETQEDLAADEAEDAESKEEREMPVRDRKRSHDTADVSEDALTATSAVTAVSLAAPPLPSEENPEGAGAGDFDIGIELSTLPATEEEQNPAKMMRGAAAGSPVVLSGLAAVAPMDMDMDFVNPTEVLAGREVLDADDSQRTASSHDSEGNIIPSVDPSRRKLVREYANSILEQIQRSLQDADEIVVFVSHADQDHYNKLPEILSKDFVDGSFNTKPITIVMGGLLSQYRGTREAPSKIFRWIERMQQLQQPSVVAEGDAAAAAEGSRPATAPVRVLFTGTQDASGETHRPLQPAYSSLTLPPASPSTFLVTQLNTLTGRIERDYGLKMDILSMNAAVTTDMTDIDPSDKSKNKNSLVLRTALVDGEAEVPGSRILLPGDAEKETWEHIGVPISMEGVEASGEDAAVAASATAAGNPNAQVDYMLLSHHGSSTEGSLTPGVLKFFNPQVLLISNGRNRDLLHPQEEGINTMYEYLRTNPHLLLTDVHAVSYYQGSISREAMAEPSVRFMRRYTQTPIFTTLDNGSITIDGLEQTMTGATITVARNHSRRTPAPLPLGAASATVVHADSDPVGLASIPVTTTPPPGDAS